MRRIIVTAALCTALVSCSRPAPDERKGAKVEKRSFGQTAEGQPVDLYVLSNANGMRAEIITYGGIVRSLEVPDRSGRIADVVLGFDSIEGYLKEHPYFGAIIGRYGNRIANARFTLEDKEYKLAANNGPNSLHGGLKGFDKRVWTVRDHGGGDDAHLTLNYVSADGEEGYPGTLDVTVKYTLTHANELKIDYTATTDKTTVLNLTNHSYFNLSGAENILDHELKINASDFTPVDATLIPTGKPAAVAETPFDFRDATKIGARINDKHEQIERGKGYDHNFVLDGMGMRVAAEVYDPKTGRHLEVSTDQPGVQFYAGNFLDGSLTGKGGRVYGHRSGFCLETQHFPDSPNQASFPSTRLLPGPTYQTTTVYKFSTK
jgi:aldose 1-epimerase